MSNYPGLKLAKRLREFRDTQEEWQAMQTRVPIRTVYLCGPITGLSYGEAKDGWRPAFAKLLPSHVRPLSPMRVVSSLMPEQGLKDMPQQAGVEAMLINRAILARDESDIRNADAVVACFLGADRASLGSVAELGMAHILRKPVIGIMEPKGNIHEHPFVTSIIGFRTETLEEAANIVTHLFTPGV